MRILNLDGRSKNMEIFTLLETLEEIIENATAKTARDVEGLVYVIKTLLFS